MKNILLSLFVISFIILLLFAFQIGKIYYYGHKISYVNIPFEQIKPDADLKILFMGDSTAVGTGAGSKGSTAAWFAEAYPNSQIRNISKNGWRLKDLLEHFSPEKEEKVDLIVIQIGANDIIKFTKYKTIAEELSTLIQKAKRLSPNIVVLHSGNVGLAPIFSWPFTAIYTERSKKVRSIYKDLAPKEGFVYVDLFQNRKDDILSNDTNRYYAFDYLHLSNEGYKIWFNAIQESMTEAHIQLGHK
jgi:lysophospholipase L1-like esterase